MDWVAVVPEEIRLLLDRNEKLLYVT